MTSIGRPKIDKRPKITYMGIRTIAPFKGMPKVIGTLVDQLNAWVGENKVKTAGPPFLRFHVIDMRGFMDISYCVPVKRALPDDGNVKADFCSCWAICEPDLFGRRYLGEQSAHRISARPGHGL